MKQLDPIEEKKDDPNDENEIEQDEEDGELLLGSKYAANSSENKSSSNEKISKSPQKIKPQSDQI